MTIKDDEHNFSFKLMNWCIPPIGWVQRRLVPPKGTPDWQRIAFQPMLYLCLWISAIVIVVADRFQTAAFASEHAGNIFWLWSGLSLLCPPMTIVSLWLIQSPHGDKKYRGLWLRLAADIGQCTAITVYLILRLAIGDWHIYPFSCLIACWIFVCHLVLRDAERIYTVEKLARKIEKHGILQLRAGD